ncbi:UBL fusion protein SDE2 isoform X4 [Rattus norvegicus]|uniref:UBL fusion protein SDE2 isoform X4 n=1 Tax=Rattus norvegicus TaxID=10116 RepID=UPI0019175080|nr:UBL fusion protein SDE2 isoform X4 [Rattus norvegicus]
MAEAAVLAWVRGPGTAWKALPCASVGCSVRDVIYRHCEEQEIPVECFFVKCNGVLVAAGDKVCHGAVYSLEPRLRGGKGGFGSMLRALGAQIEKTTNREACRDLSGRRLRDVNHEKAIPGQAPQREHWMAEWVKQQAEREAEKEQRRLERLQRKLAEPAHCFASPDYQRQCHEMAERLEDSVLKDSILATSDGAYDCATGAVNTGRSGIRVISSYTVLRLGLNEAWSQAGVVPQWVFSYLRLIS